MDFITIGSATRDILFYTQEGVLIENYPNLLKQRLLGFEFGAKITSDYLAYTFGGGAANSAVNFANLGFNTACFTCISQDEKGEQIQQNLQDKKVKMDMIQTHSPEETDFSFVVIGPGQEHVIFNHKGASKNLKVSKSDIDKLDSGRWLYVTSMSGNWREKIKKIFSVKYANIAWNPGSTQLQAGYKKLKPFLKKTNILGLNQDEALELALTHPSYGEKDKEYLSKTKNLLKIISNMGPKTVVITKGKQGAEVYSSLEKKYYFKRAKNTKKIKDTTGLGDAFNSSFVAGMYKYEDVDKALQLAVDNAGSVIKQTGAQNGLLTKRI